MIRTRIFVSMLSLIALLCVSCGDDESFTTNPNSFRGNWNITFSGDYVGQGTLVIDPNGVFFNSMTLENGNGMVDLAGTVTSDGVIEAQIMRSSSPIGTMKGTLSGSQGNGTWQTTDGKMGNFQMARL